MTAPTLGQRSDNLPGQVTRFIGRRRELPAITGALERHRLVTLRGAAGVGKTRLALRVAADIKDTFTDGCWLVELSALRTPALLPATIAAALGLPDEAVGGSAEVLAAALADRELLLVLDTCERLVEACASLAQVLLGAVPGLRILTTSREPLGVPDEHALLISPLALPPAADSPPRDVRGPQADAVTLFVDRAQASAPTFELTVSNAAAVFALCRRLDGIPLALELAAVRLRGMPVEEILDRLTDRFAILGSARTATGRHRTLRAAVAWSHELCTRDEQRLWAELAVFPGSFGLEAAEQICGPDTFETLIRLVEKSIIAFNDEGHRYHLLDTMREFGAEQLAGRADELRARHRDYYLGLARQSAAGSLSAAQASWLARLGTETDNLRAALTYSFDGPGQRGAGLAMTTRLRPYWLMVGQFTEGRRWHTLAVEIDPGSSDNDWAVYGAGILAVQQGDEAAGVPLLDRAAARAAETGNEDLAAHVADAQGIVAFNRGEPELARARFETALASYARIGFGDPLGLVTYSRLASVCLLALDLDEALRLCQECLRHCDELGDQWARGTALWVRGAARWLSSDIPAAIADARACLRLKVALGDLHTIAMSFDLLSVTLVASEDFERAAVLYGASDALWTMLSAPVLMGPAYADIRQSAADTARDRLGPERGPALIDHGRSLPLPDAIAVATGEAPASPVAPGGETAAAPGGPAVRPLTRREREIADLVAAGLGNRDIAERLVLSKRTVDSHIDHIFTKLGFSSRTQLVNWILERGQ